MNLARSLLICQPVQAQYEGGNANIYIFYPLFTAKCDSFI